MKKFRSRSSPQNSGNQKSQFLLVGFGAFLFGFFIAALFVCSPVEPETNGQKYYPSPNSDYDHKKEKHDSTRIRHSREYSHLSAVDRRRQEILDEMQDGVKDPERYNDLINEFNYKLPPRNMDKFPELAADAIPIILVVHMRDTYLKYTLDFYRQNFLINETLMIISHDGVYEDTRNLIDSIDFCQVKQLLFPYNYDHVEALGKVMEVGLSFGRNHGTLKLHWLWAATQVRTVIGGDRFGDVAYMEDDFWISPDYYRSLKLMRNVRDRVCPDCFGSIVGEHPHDWTTRQVRIRSIFENQFHMGTETELSCPRNSLAGLAIPRRQWNNFREHSHIWCNLDSNHWDDPIKYMMGKAQNYTVPPYLLKTNYPRVTHVGRCGGLHFRGEKKDASICDVSIDARNFKKSWIDPWLNPRYPLNQIDMKFQEPLEIDQNRQRCLEKYSVPGVGVAKLHALSPIYKQTCNKIATDPYSHQEIFSTTHDRSLASLEPWKMLKFAKA